jgi:DnaJ like chaperone protein
MLGGPLGALLGAALGHRFDKGLKALPGGDSSWGAGDQERVQTAFFTATFSVLGHLAKADGQVTRDEVMAFREVFHIAAEDEAGAAKVFNLARQDVAGFEEYATRIRAIFDGHPQTLNDLMEGLFHIAMADGFYHPNEDAFLERVSDIFELTELEFRALKARFVPDADPDPFAILGVTPEMSLDEMRQVWRKMVREYHPDAMVARGVPEEAIRLAERRMIDINRAWDEIRALRG